LTIPITAGRLVSTSLRLTTESGLAHHMRVISDLPGPQSCAWTRLG
jgi:hypothetical protein